MDERGNVRLDHARPAAQAPKREAVYVSDRCLAGVRGRDGLCARGASSEEICDLCPIGREPDLLALRSIRHFPDATIRELRRLDRSFLRSKRDPKAARRVDADFHRALIGSCPNHRLLNALTPIKAATERYDPMYMGDETDVIRSGARHAAIIDALKAGDMESAAMALGKNWTYGFERLLSMIGTLR
jgi:DNA-binding GntR family transcriptional regulator